MTRLFWLIVAVMLAASFAVFLAGCGTVVADRSWARCDMIRIAFDESDELAPAWYLQAAEELRACGMRHYDQDAGKGRGKS